MDGYGNVELLSECEISIHGSIARRNALILQTDLAHYFEAASGEILTQFFESNTLTGRHTILKRCARDDPCRGGVLPFLYALRIAKGYGRHVETLHLR